MRTFVIGSLHISRLEKYLQQCYDLQVWKYEIKIRGVSGGHTNTLYRHLVELHNFRPDLVLIKIGSNDISTKGSKISCAENNTISINHHEYVLVYRYSMYICILIKI